MIEQANTILFWVCAALLIGFLYGPWQRFWTDWFRQELFSARDKLFDMALCGKLSFNDQSYKKQRQMLDLMIKFADQATWPQMVLELIVMRLLNSPLTKSAWV